MPTARDEVLGRVRAAMRAGSSSPSGGATARQEPSDDQPCARSIDAPGPGGDPNEPFAVTRFTQRVRDYGAAVESTGGETVERVLTELCAMHGVKRLAHPAGLPGEWLPRGPELVADSGTLERARVESADAVLTGCAGGAAETGTILLDHGPEQGRRVLTLLPDLHFCVISRSQVHLDIPDLTPLIASAAEACRPVTLISGPSATSDIELRRVEGVHGPRRLVIIITDEQTPESR